MFTFLSVNDSHYIVLTVSLTTVLSNVLRYSGTIHWCLWRCGRHHTTTTTTTLYYYFYYFLTLLLLLQLLLLLIIILIVITMKNNNVSRKCLAICINIKNRLNFMCSWRAPEKYVTGAALDRAANYILAFIISTWKKKNKSLALLMASRN
jgi:hypothetical protein